MKWYIPSWNGDLRLEADGKTTVLSIIKPTPDEIKVLGQMKAAFIDKDWISESDWKNPSRWRKREVIIDAPIEKVGPVTSKIMRPGEAVLTAMTFADGTVTTHSGAQTELEEMAAEAADSDKKVESAATVKRPTPCCPQCLPGAVEPANEVLQAFLSPEQHETWAKDRTMLVTGGLSGVSYLLAHRLSKTAAEIGRICFDVDSDCVVHFHDRSVPPEEEVLAAKLILEHREPWLRNEATMFGTLKTPKFKNPFGNGMDGVPDAGFTTMIGSYVAGGGMRD